MCGLLPVVIVFILLQNILWKELRHRAERMMAEIIMKITDIKTIRAEQYLFVQLLPGRGDNRPWGSGTWAYLGNVRAIHRFKRLPYDRAGSTSDPEHHWQYLYRAHHFAVREAISRALAILISLWNIAGRKYHNVPSICFWVENAGIKVRTYFHVIGGFHGKIGGGAVSVRRA